MRRQNIEKFTNEMQQLKRNSVTDRHLTVNFIESYRRNTITVFISKRKIDKPYYSNKRWLTNAMKESIKMKKSLPETMLMHLMRAAKGTECIETN